MKGCLLILGTLLPQLIGGFIRGDQRRAVSYLTNPILAEGSCFDREELGSAMELARSQCPAEVQSSRSYDWRRVCSTLQMIMGQCAGVAKADIDNESEEIIVPDMRQACGTHGGKPCSFPFYYKSINFTGCTFIDLPNMDFAWCATETTDFGANILGWDYCLVPTCKDSVLPPHVEPVRDNWCYLRQLGWVTGDGASVQFQPNAVRNDVNTMITDEYVKNCLLDAMNQCISKPSINQEWTVTGPLAGVTQINLLACIDNRFTRFCNYRLELLGKSLAES